MEILRIPNRYNKSLMRLSEKKRLWVYDSLIKLSLGQDIIDTDDWESDLLTQIWRECKLMEGKNGKGGLFDIGKIYSAGNPAGNSRAKVKESKVKESISSNELDDIIEFFNKTCSTSLKPTDKKKTQIRNRLKTFTVVEIKTAIQNRVKIPWYAGGSNDGQIWYKDWDSLFRNDEKIEKILNLKPEKQTEIKVSTSYPTVQ